jgi:hypothetical protein
MTVLPGVGIQALKTPRIELQLVVPHWQFREIPADWFITEIKFCEFLNI